MKVEAIPTVNLVLGRNEVTLLTLVLGSISQSMVRDMLRHTPNEKLAVDAYTVTDQLYGMLSNA